MKTNLLLSKGLIAAFVAAVCVTVSFGQNDRARQDLGRSFRKFEMQRVAELPPAAFGHRSLRIKAEGRDIQLDIEPHDLRSRNYRSEDSSAPGQQKPAISEVITYKGVVDGDDTSPVRLTISGGKIEGYFVTRGKRFFIEPARKYTNLAEPDDAVVYQAEDSLVENSILCDSDIPTQIEGGKGMVETQAAELLTTLQDIELATEADQQYVTALGGPAAANNEILSILNMTEGVYQSELNLSITVVYQHTWSTPDPFDATSMNTILDSFLAYWNANFPVSSVHRDAAHLFTAKSAALSAGLAYVGTICRSPAYAYGISGHINWAPGKFLVSTHEIGHNLGANHVDAAQNCASTIMNAQLSSTTALTFCTYSRNEINTYVSANGSCLTPGPGGTPTPTPTPVPTPTATPTPPPPTGARTRFDFDGDGRADISQFRPSAGTWYLMRSSAGFGAFQFGLLGDKPVPADYDGDGKTDGAVYRAGTWWRMRSADNTFDLVAYGLASDIPAPADFDGDGRVDAAVFRPSNGMWYIRNSSNGGSTEVRFGLNGDVPAAADFDGDGRADICLFRPSNGVWYRLNSSTGSFVAVQFGLNGDKPLIGDFDGDGRSDIAVWRPSNGVWYILNSSTGSYSGSAFGLAGDIPAAADYDGDRRSDVAVFRPSTGTWYRLLTSSGSVLIDRFGLNGDIPAAGFYIQ
jgi:hypothetical protein